jgi:hypothetical protein
MAAVEVCSVIARETRPNARKCLSVYLHASFMTMASTYWPQNLLLKANSKRIKCVSFVHKVACKDGVT